MCLAATLRRVLWCSRKWQATLSVGSSCDVSCRHRTIGLIVWLVIPPEATRRQLRTTTARYRGQHEKHQGQESRALWPPLDEILIRPGSPLCQRQQHHTPQTSRGSSACHTRHTLSLSHLKHGILYRSTAGRAQNLHYPSFSHLPLFSSASLATMILKLCRDIGTMIMRATIAGRLSSLPSCI